MSTTDATTRQEPIRISWNDERQALIVLEGEDRFMAKCSEVARMCAESEKTASYIDQYRELLGAMAHWLRDNRDVWEACYVGWCDGHTEITVVSKMTGFDHDLSDRLADLERLFAKRFDLVDCEINHLPNRPSLIDSCTQTGAMSFVG